MRQAWRATGYLLTGARTGFAALVTLAALGLAAVLAVGVGLPLLQPTKAAMRAAAAADRRRAHRLLGLPSPPASEPDPPSRREIAWLAIHGITGIPVAVAVLIACVLVTVTPFATLAWWALPPGESFAYLVTIDSWTRAATLPPLFGAVAAATLWSIAPVLARWHAKACRALLAPGAAAVLAARVERLAATRADALDAHAAELRRIERDLHDGAQARLVTIAIQLGVAQRQRAAAPEVADQLVERARAGVEDALAELRGVARSVYPPILADRGLVGAVHALVADCPVPLRLRAGPLGRLPAAVEGAAYFVVAEALTNIAKHSRAERGAVELGLAGDRLLLEVCDDGAGGADESRGTGLAGIRRRVAALDGEASITSPPGGPTTVRVELPCAS